MPLGDRWDKRLRKIFRVKKACNKAGVRFWADYEIFDWNDRPLRPCDIKRIKCQMPSLEKHAEKIVCCQLPGLMEDEKFTHPVGGEKASKLLKDYMNEICISR